MNTKKKIKVETVIDTEDIMAVIDIIINAILVHQRMKLTLKKLMNLELN